VALAVPGDRDAIAVPAGDYAREQFTVETPQAGALIAR
jgi:hypothetical protein